MASQKKTHYIHGIVGPIPLKRISSDKKFHFERYSKSYDQHGIRNLVFADTTTQNYHPSFARLARKFIEGPNIAHDVDDQSRVFERMKVDHIPERPVCKCRTEDRDIVLYNISIRTYSGDSKSPKIRIHFVRPIVH